LATRVFDDGTAFEIEDRLTRRLNVETRITAYRIVQEAISNARRHARAAHVTITLEEVGGELVARVLDNGIGIDASKAAQQPGHLGLTTMRERAESRLGTLSIRRRHPNGTMVELRLPNAWQSEDGGRE
jgi:signal transduction histidine kinase